VAGWLGLDDANANGVGEDRGWMDKKTIWTEWDVSMMGGRTRTRT
jgi:hypothetical protein